MKKIGHEVKPAVFIVSYLHLDLIKQSVFKFRLFSLSTETKTIEKVPTMKEKRKVSIFSSESDVEKNMLTKRTELAK